MLFSKIDILDSDLNLQRDMYVGVKDGIIKYIGKEKPLEDFGESYNGRGKLLMSGFINAHSHSAMTLMRGYAENMTLSDWLYKRIFPFEAKLYGEAVYYGTMLAAAEMVRLGIVSTTDMYYLGEYVKKAVLESGIKMNYGTSISVFDDRHLRELDVYGEIKALTEQYAKEDENGRFKFIVAPHSEYTTTPLVIREVAEYALENSLDVTVHVSETRSEQEACKARHNGKTPVRYFYDLGLLNSRSTLAHCVYIEGEDFDLLKEKGVSIATCPVSNLKLASGIAPVHKMLDLGINVAIGTDSVVSNNNLNMMEEIKLVALLYKGITGDPCIITPKDAIYAATRAGAISQGRYDTGELKVGNRADLIVLDFEKTPYAHPVHSTLNNLVFSMQGTDVVLTMVDGRVLYKDGEYTTVDIEKVIYNVESIAKRLAD